MEDLLTTMVAVFYSTMSSKMVLKKCQFSEIELQNSKDFQFVPAKHCLIPLKLILAVFLSEILRFYGLKQICRLSLK